MTEVLQFGGGKDSLACLYLLREKWPTLTVVYMNTSAAFPETLEQIDRIRSLVKVVEAKSDVFANIEQHGWPTDVLPVRSAWWGKQTTGDKGLLLQSWWNCCFANFWTPMHQKTLELGATVIYRGQRISEDYKSPVRDGAVIEGVTYRFPLEGWSEADVERYLGEQGVPIPAHYAETKKSLDCWCCTAYLDAKLDQLKYLQKHHPEKYGVVAGKLQELHEAVSRGMEPIEAAYGHTCH